MAKQKMKAFTIVALKKDRKFLLEHLQDRAIVELKPAKEPEEGFELPDFSARQQTFERYRVNADKALKILDEYAPEKKSLLSSFAGRREVEADEIGEFAASASATMEYGNKIIALSKRCADNAAEQVRLKTAIAQLEPWAELDIPFSLDSTAKTAVIIGSVPMMTDEKQLSEVLAQDADLVFDLEIVSSSRDITCFVLAVPKEQRAAAEAQLRTVGFSYPSVTCRKEPKSRSRNTVRKSPSCRRIPPRRRRSSKRSGKSGATWKMCATILPSGRINMPRSVH